MGNHQPLCFVLAVWNELYVNLYLKYALPSQLADGNLNALNRITTYYCIYTRKSDQSLIEAHPLYKKLQFFVNVEFNIIDERIADNRLRAGYCFGMGVEYAKSKNAAVVLVMPDVLYSAGSFRYMQQQLQIGYRAILLACHTTEQIQAESLLKPYVREGGSIELTGRECVDIVMDAMHPNTREKFFIETTRNLMPACLCWSVGNQGIITHAFHLTPLLVFPRDMKGPFLGTIDREFIFEANIRNDEIIVVQDSDDCCMFELATANHIVSSPYRKGNPDDIIDWAIIHANPQHRAIFAIPARLRSTRYSEEYEQQWLQVEMQASAVVEYVENILNQPKQSLMHYIKFRYAYLRKFLLTVHTLEWQRKSYRGKIVGKSIVAAHKVYLLLASTFARIQQRAIQHLLQNIRYWPNRLSGEIPFTKIIARFEQWTLNNKSPMLLQMIAFPIKFTAMWLAVLLFNLLVGGLRIARN